MHEAFFELEDGGAQALLTLVEFAMKLQQEKIATKLPRDSCTTVHGLR